MYEVAYVKYNLDGTWTDETFFRGTKVECQKWLAENCASSFEICCGKPEEQFWLGNKHLEIYEAN